MKYKNITKAVFFNKPNRFIANVEIDGTENRKTKYELVAVRKNTGILFNIDSQAPNKVVKEWIEVTCHVLRKSKRTEAKT